MNYNPAKYKHYSRTPIGCFSAEMTANGWANTKFDHDLQEHLVSDEVGEFVRLVHHFFKECSDLAKLDKFVHKYGTEIEGEDYSTTLAFNFEEEVMDYTFCVDRTKLTAFPYRKSQHKNFGRYE